MKINGRSIGTIWEYSVMFHVRWFFGGTGDSWRRRGTPVIDRLRVWLLRDQFGDGYGVLSPVARLKVRLFRAITPSGWTHPWMRA